MAAGDGCALLLACFIPRAVAAWHWDVLWSDTLHYIYASESLERGDFERGFAEFGLNFYPLLLIPLRHLGIDWQLAGRWFGVLVATLTVVPLWGWLRRMFDDRTAILACLVYALHGKLIAISPLIIRDSTFWLLLATTLYLLWRAASESRLSYYLAAGAVMTLAVHTRTEGWLLVVPLVGWTAWQPRWSSGFSRRNHRLKSELQPPGSSGTCHPVGPPRRRRLALSCGDTGVGRGGERDLAPRPSALGHAADRTLERGPGLADARPRTADIAARPRRAAAQRSAGNDDRRPRGQSHFC